MFSVNSTGVVTGLSNGAGTLRADLDGVSGTATVVVDQVAAAVEIVSGDGQYGLVGERLRDPVGVRTLDAGGSPIPGVNCRIPYRYGRRVGVPSCGGGRCDGHCGHVVDAWQRRWCSVSDSGGRRRPERGIQGHGPAVAQ